MLMVKGKPMAKRKKQITFSRRRPLLIIIVALVALGGLATLIASHADTASYPATTHAAYYSCNSGDSLSGSTCKHTYTGTLTSYTYCSNGADTLSGGNTCTHYYGATPKPTCKSGDTLDSSTGKCVHYDGPAGGLNGKTCPSGETESFYKCYTYYTPTTIYCNSGDIHSGNHCIHTYPASTGTRYVCTSGDSLSGSTCAHMYAATYHATTYSCNSGDTLIGSTCFHSSTSSGGGGSGGSTHKSNGGSGSTSSIPQPPAAPTGFTATVQSDKIVELSWNPSTASAGIANYVLNRSTDNVNWSPLVTVTDTTYEDSATDFNSTYYYQLEAVDNSGNVSPYSTAQATTGTFSSTSNKITSDDKLVTVEIPDGAFSGNTDCTVSSGDSSNIASGSSKTVLLLGPYSMLCVDSSGAVIDTFNKPVTVTMNLAQAGASFGNFSAKTIDGSKTTSVKSTYDAKKKTINFQLTAAETFGAYGVRQKSAGGAIVSVFLILLFLVLLLVGFRFLRRRMLAAHDPSIPSSAAVEQQFEQAVNKPNCTHLDQAHQVQPQSEGCQECIAAGRKWKDLRICLTCGHVGCSDDSEGQDARKHFEQTGHPLIMAYNNPAVGNIGWCYIDQTYI